MPRSIARCLLFILFAFSQRVNDAPLAQRAVEPAHGFFVIEVHRVNQALHGRADDLEHRAVADNLERAGLDVVVVADFLLEMNNRGERIQHDARFVQQRVKALMRRR